MRTLKWILGLLSVAALIVCLLFIYLAVSFNPNDYKETIVNIVKDKTGRDLEIEGDMSLSFYPWLGIELGKTRLRNAKGFEPEYFAEFNNANARLKLLPILQKKIEADSIELNQAEIWLARNKQGVSNWQDVLDKLSTDNPDAQSDTVNTPFSANVAGFKVQNVTLHWLDEVSNDQLKISNLNLLTGALSLNEEISIETDFDFSLVKPVIQGHAKLVARSKLNFSEPYELFQPNLVLDLQGLDLQAQNIQANIVGEELLFENGIAQFSQPNIVFTIQQMPALGELTKGSIQAEGMRIDAGDLSFIKPKLLTNIEGSALPGKQANLDLISEQLTYAKRQLIIQNGQLSADFSGEPWPQGQQNIQAELPSFSYHTQNNTLEANRLLVQALGLDINLNVAGENLDNEQLTLTGRIQSDNFSPKELAKILEIRLPEMSDEAWQNANVKGDYVVTKNSMALNDMIANIDTVDWTGSFALSDIENKRLSFNLQAKSLDANRLLPPEQADALSETDDKSQNKVNAIEIPTDALKTWDAKGNLSLERFVFGNIEATELSASIDLADGLLSVSPTKMQLFSGTERGEWELDVRGDVPKLTANEVFENIDLAEVGQALWQEQYMTGKMTGNFVVNTQGKTIGEMRAGLNGQMSANIDDGVLQGVDLDYSLANAVSLFREKTLAADVENTQQTPFDNLSATGTITAGVLTNKDFLAVLPRMRVSGAGSFSFIDTAINYGLNADILESKAANLPDDIETNLDELVGASIPIKITGDMQALDIRPDVTGYLSNRIRNEAQERIEEEVKETLRDKVGDRLGGALGDLFGIENEEESSSETETSTESSETKPDDIQADNSEKEAGAAENKQEISEQNTDEKKDEPTDEPEEQDLEDELKKKAKDKLKDLFGG